MIHRGRVDAALAGPRCQCEKSSARGEMISDGLFAGVDAAMAVLCTQQRVPNVCWGKPRRIYGEKQTVMGRLRFGVIDCMGER
jgi:hypothetical protein